MIAVVFQCSAVGGGAFSRILAQAMKAIPGTIQREEAIKNGGRVSIAYRIPRYVDPQIR
jgi:hypothetical protein